MLKLTWEYVDQWIKFTEEYCIKNDFKTVFGIPRGGMILAGFFRKIKNVYTPEEADILVDDIIDSGKTKQKYDNLYPRKPFFALINKESTFKDSGWIVFPWELDDKKDYDDDITRILQHNEVTVSDFTIKMMKDNIEEYIKNNDWR